MIELKEGVTIIRVKYAYYWVWSGTEYIQIESEGKSWQVQSIDEFLEKIDCVGHKVTQYKLTKI